ncbi:MAG: MBL fold metallo-hydrolase [Candidatus Hodarchaeales archaeon]
MDDNVSFTLLYDKPTLPNFHSGWGLSLWIEFKERTILFDTGWNGELLLSNISRLKLDVNHITDIFLSHAHWDHVGGIVFLLNRKLKSLEHIFVPKSFSKHFKEELSVMARVVEVPRSNRPINLLPYVWSTGEMESPKIFEHSLILELKDKNLFLVTGCGHPLLDNIMNQSSQIGTIRGVLGGFHDFNNLKSLDGLRNIIPIHCTKKKNEIKQMYKDEYIELKVGGNFSFRF